MMEKAASWSTENTSSIVPAAAPSLPVAGAGLKAATTITTTVALMTMAAKNWNAVPVLSEVGVFHGGPAGRGGIRQAKECVGVGARNRYSNKTKMKISQNPGIVTRMIHVLYNIHEPKRMARER